MVKKITKRQNRDFYGRSWYLMCRCQRGPSGTVLDGVRDEHCIFDDRELLFDGPAGTGKTYSDCLRTLYFCEKYPGVRVLWLRETMKSLRGSVLPIFESIIGPDHPVLKKGGTAANRDLYEFPNGSIIEIGGTDNIERYRSAEFDKIIVFEATDPRIKLHQWTTVLGRLRGRAIPHPHCDYPDGIMPGGVRVVDAMLEGRFEERVINGRVIEKGYDDHGHALFWRQMTGECNPDMIQGEEHWLFQRWKRGHMIRIQGSHADNPVADADYMNTLRSMPEPWRSAYFEGKWVSAEGKCWPTYDPRRHLIAGQFTRDPVIGRRYVTVGDWLDDQGQPKVFSIGSVVAGFDWGAAHAGSFQVVAVTTANEFASDKIAFRIAELHAHDKTLDWWTERIIELVEKLGIEAILCDPSAKTTIMHVNSRMGSRHGRTGKGIVEPADNTHATKDWLMGGIDVVRTMFGADRLFLFTDCHHGPRDEALCMKKHPTGLHEEIVGYMLERDKLDPQKVLPHPDKKRGLDDACDAFRYVLVDVFARDRILKPKPMRSDMLDDGHKAVPGHILAELERSRMRAPAIQRDSRW